MCLYLHESVSDHVSSSRRRKEETRACVLVSPPCAAKRKHELGSAASAVQSSFHLPPGADAAALGRLCLSQLSGPLLTDKSLPGHHDHPLCKSRCTTSQTVCRKQTNQNPTNLFN